VRRDPDHADLERSLAEHGERLLHIAIALTGSRADGEDPLQAAQERLLPRWPFAGPAHVSGRPVNASPWQDASAFSADAG
jgi:DNA-directed RNA polymerase specialized sigma24 family protein